jgi:hypothetical protein
MSLFAGYAAAVAILKTIAEAWTWALLPPVRFAMPCIADTAPRPTAFGSGFRPALQPSLPTTEEVQHVRSV